MLGILVIGLQAVDGSAFDLKATLEYDLRNLLLNEKNELQNQELHI